MARKTLPLIMLRLLHVLMLGGWIFPATAASEKPNILFIAIDDLRPELGTYGSRAITPNIDKLAASGIRFDHAYCQQAVCGASRFSIMSGLYPTRSGEHSFHIAGWQQRHPDLLTLNKHFKSSGYQTIGLGKIYHGTGGDTVDTANWSQWINLAAPQYALPENTNKIPGGFDGKPKGPTTEAAIVPDDTYIDGIRANRAVKLLGELVKEKNKPFFLAVGFTKPHLPFVAPKKYWDFYQRNDFSMPTNQSIPPGYPQAAANLRAHEMNMYADTDGIHPKDFSDEQRKRLIHGYFAATSYADANVGRVLAALESSGLAQNTIVVLWGDHGFKLGDHGTWVKHTNFEIDTRVPLIICDPRTPRASNAAANGQPSKQLVELIDLYPTLCDLAGIPTPPHCQGKSLRKLLENPAADHRDSAYSCYPSGVGMGHSIRIGKYRYTEWHKGKGKPTTRVLTDLVADPGETTNVINDPAHADALRRATEQLQQRITTAEKFQK